VPLRLHSFPTRRSSDLGVRPSRRSFRSGNLRQFEPRVFGEQLHQSLPDDAGRTENSGVPFSSHVLDPLVFLLASRRLAIPPVPRSEETRLNSSHVAISY